MKETCMTNPNDRAAQDLPIFLDETEASGDNDEGQSPPGRRRDSRPSTKHDRYEVKRIEKGISRRVRRNGTGTAAYEAQVWVNGRALTKTFSLLRDARRWRDEMLGDRATGRAKIPADRRVTVSQFVVGEWHPWLDEQVRFGNLRVTTTSWYKSGAQRLVRELGRVKLSTVGKRELRGMLSRCVEAGDSDSVIRQLRTSTSSMLALAVERDILTSSPSGFMSGRNAPRSLKRSDNAVKAWSGSEAQAFLSHVEGDRLEALWILLLGSGLRRGEAVGLRWDDIDFMARTVSVSRTLGVLNGALVMSKPKTGTSARTISVGESVIVALRAHRRRQVQERLAADDWPEDEGHVFLGEMGGSLRPDYTTRRLKKLVKEAGLTWIKLHGLRHTMASLALQNGVDIATVSERLGHADTNITARIYLHGSKESDRAAADVLDVALHG
jgi:integrase